MTLYYLVYNVTYGDPVHMGLRALSLNLLLSSCLPNHRNICFRIYYKLID